MLTVDEVEGEYALHLPGTDNACLFCESVGPMTEEHVWAKWISRELASRGRNFAPRPGERRPPQEIDYTALVCKECNTGWMSVLENDIKTVMSSMLYGDFVVLSPADQDLLALWALKTAFMIDRLNESVVPRGYPMGLAIERRPSDNCVVLLGAFDGNIAAMASHQPGGSLVTGEPAALTVTFTVDKLAFQVVMHFTQGEMRLSDDRPVGVAHKIWPRLNEVAVTWPPPILLVDDDFEWFCSSLSLS